jgi:phosphinothricin acetyltransferase
MQVRAPRDEDFPAIARITNHYITTTTIHFGYEPVVDAEIRDQWQRYRETFPWLVLDDGDAVVGYAKAGTWRERAAYRWTAEAGLYLADGVRGRGLGRLLYGALLDELARRTFHSVIAGIALPNDASIGLHRALGFVSVGVVEDAGWKNGAWHSVEFWQKRLAASDEPPPSASCAAAAPTVGASRAAAAPTAGAS